MGFRLCNALATFSRAMNLVLRGLTWNIVLAFLDDALVLGKDFEDHLTNLRSVFARFREFDLKFKPTKCAFFQRRVESFGRQAPRCRRFPTLLKMWRAFCVLPSTIEAL